MGENDHHNDDVDKNGTQRSIVQRGNRFWPDWIPGTPNRRNQDRRVSDL